MWLICLDPSPDGAKRVRVAGMLGTVCLLSTVYLSIPLENNPKFKQINKSLYDYVKVRQCLLHTDLQHLTASVMAMCQ